ncbi:MAG: hypothetical protein KAT71_05350 [Gammaproteobacteria bacterium]|nr:hypothetical protein [Gammaproteobacteria bacterium]
MPYTNINSSILVAGGWHKVNNITTFVAATELFSPTANSWHVVGQLPQGRDGVRMVALKDKVYLWRI